MSHLGNARSFLIALFPASSFCGSSSASQNTLMSKWRGRRRHGVVTGIKDLGIVRQIRDSRLIPFRLGCDCLYDHPVLSHLFNRYDAPLMRVWVCLLGIN